MSFSKKFQASFILGLLTLALFQSATIKLNGAEEGVDSRAEAILRGAHRIVFLGDSITQMGDYVTDCECWLVAHGYRIEVLNLGLASETASDLTATENFGHLLKYGFGRPFLSERLNRTLAMTKPDILFTCYGMNDGSCLPPDANGTRRFADAIMHLHEAATKAGVKWVVICTPPVHDYMGDAQRKNEDENLARYTAWLLFKRGEGWDVVDFHTPMTQALDESRARNPTFKFANDGIHPGREGHWLMAREILNQFFGAKLDDVGSAEGLFRGHGNEIRRLVHTRMELLFDAWMTQIGHKRPGVAGGPGAKTGLPIAQANAKAADIARQINVIIASKSRTPLFQLNLQTISFCTVFSIVTLFLTLWAIHRKARL